MAIERLPFKGVRVVRELHGGSRRSFLRVDDGIITRIVMHADKEEISRYTKIAKLLLDRGINVPMIYDVKDEFLLMEDVGNMSLYEFVRKYGFNLDIYERVIEELINLQKASIDGLPLFGENRLIGEFEHFKEYYARQFKLNIDAWEEFVKSAVRDCMTVEFVPMHRDFQSTNIYIKEEKIYFLDFQDMYRGPACFDLAALLYDPYIMMQHSYREDLLEFYRERSTYSFDNNVFLSCAMLRIMQALGAFVRLSNEGKNFFKGFIRKGKCTLKNILRDRGFDEAADML